MITCTIPQERKAKFGTPVPDMERVNSFDRKSPPICRKCGLVLSADERQRFGILCLDDHIREWKYRMRAKYGRLR